MQSQIALKVTVPSEVAPGFKYMPLRCNMAGQPELPPADMPLVQSEVLASVSSQALDESLGAIELGMGDDKKPAQHVAELLEETVLEATFIFIEACTVCSLPLVQNPCEN